MEIALAVFVSLFGLIVFYGSAADGDGDAVSWAFALFGLVLLVLPWVAVAL